MHRLVHTRRLLAALVAVGAVTGCGGDAVVRPEANAADDRIHVSGSASVEVAPDIASATIGVRNFDADAATAVTDNSIRVAAVIGAVRALGVAEQDLQTQNISVSPQRDYKEDRPDSITGFWVSNTVALTVRDVSLVGEVLQAAIEAGANEVYGLQFAISNPDSIQDVARELAVADARRRAEVLAAAAGVRVGQVISLSEGSVSIPPNYRGDYEAAADAGAVPIEAGEVTVTANVQMVFAIE